MSAEVHAIVKNIETQNECIDCDPEQYQRKAKFLVAESFNTTFLSTSDLKAAPVHFYVVWFAKTLGNWKALISTDLMSGQYWEVTHNGNKDETYVDHYRKVSNRAFSDAGYNRRYPLG